jgi:hypothetical protein
MSFVFFSNFFQDSIGGPSFSVSKTAGENVSGHEDLLNGMELAAATEEKETHSFEIDPSQVFLHLVLKIGNVFSY